MKVFQRIKKQYAILGISSSNRWTQKYPFSMRVFLGFLIFGCVFVSHIVYIFRVANGFMEYMNSISSTSATIVTSIGFAAIVFRTTTLFQCIDNIEKLIDTRCKYPKSRKFILQTIQEIERTSEVALRWVMKIAFQCVMLPTCVASIMTYFTTDSGRDSFELPIPMWFPFDSSNLIGYLIAAIIEYVLVGYEYFIIACNVACFMGMYRITISATKEIQRILHLINDKTKETEIQSNELKILFSEYIDAHAAIKQVANDFSDIFQPSVMTLFVWSLLSISGAMLMIQIELLHHDSGMSLLLLSLSGVIGFALVFIACEFGQRMSDAFEEIEPNIDQFNWYLFPIEIRRMLIIIIANAQQEIELECFGSFACTREVFKKVIHSAYSYFMVLRQLGD